MKKLLKKISAFALAAVVSCTAFTACDLFVDLELIGEPTWAVIQEEDGAYTVIVEGYAKNQSSRDVSRSLAWVSYYDINQELIREDTAEIDKISKSEIWHFYIKTENLSIEPTSFNIIAFEDW